MLLKHLTKIETEHKKEREVWKEEFSKERKEYLEMLNVQRVTSEQEQKERNAALLNAFVANTVAMAEFKSSVQDLKSFMENFDKGFERAFKDTNDKITDLKNQVNS